MSWDIFVQDLPPGLQTVADFPDEFTPRADIVARAELDRVLREVAPAADFTDRTWVLIDGPGYSIEVNVEDRPVLDGFAFHVRGGGPAAAVVAAVLSRLGLRAIDPQSESGLFEPERAAESFAAWQRYRDHVLNHFGGLPPLTEGEGS